MRVDRLLLRGLHVCCPMFVTGPYDRDAYKWLILATALLCHRRRTATAALLRRGRPGRQWQGDRPVVWKAAKPGPVQGHPAPLPSDHGASDGQPSDEPSTKPSIHAPRAQGRGLHGAKSHEAVPTPALTSVRPLGAPPHAALMTWRVSFRPLSTDIA